MLELNTERLYLRTMVEADWPLFLRLHREPQTMQYVFGDIGEEMIRRGFDHRLPAWNPQSDHWLCLVVIDRQSRQELGVSGFRILSPGHAEIGGLLLPEHQGQGYGTESWHAVIDYAAAIGLESLEATVTDGNIASCKLQEKCGFTFERRVPQAYQIGDQWFDDLIYRLQLGPLHSPSLPS
ncbi:GNAT family N-acetyltransferase [Pseudomonas alliivorans]|nr:GNAT family N-acetyltransferase [Pseudomonas alliivorans]MEE4882638.1 GNAT family N-acetyltransferase [Pseudomonas alliivorans]MEE4961944.1 GNAT family N-acetyltransferase [Pseudomonas alliivorans]MEE4971732.1 GNAT family N-acetyltransferase [Pseudomonas alliivorans]MEE4977124.1 GNAT family N-acetyltransferase [Pseudomonas alliivorans]